MSTITFYRQARRDGGVRTGIDINDDTVLARFEEGRSDDDPSLVWYVDVRCRGTALPRDSQGARRWLIQRGKTIGRVLRALADEVPAGIDPTDAPLRKVVTVGANSEIEVAASAVRRVEASRISEILRDIADHWADRVRSLPAVEG